MRLAAADVRKSISLKPSIPWSHLLLLNVVSGHANSPQMETVFQAAIKVNPGYYELYRARLWSLTPKWGGSVAAMYAFVDRYAAPAPDNSALKLMYLHLYAYLLDAAHFDCRSLGGYRLKQCMDVSMTEKVLPGLNAGVLKALNLYKSSDPIQYSRAVWPILGSMASSANGGSSGFNGVLQMAASVMGSDNRIMDETGHNSYVLDDITAHVWADIGNSANADKKYREALSDIDHTSFPDEVQKDEAVAGVLDDMTEFANNTSQFINMIVYHDAANLVGGSNHGNAPYMKCYAYYRLKYFSAAVRECSDLIDGSGNYFQTHYWRAKAYEGLGQWDASLADFAPLADGANNWLRVGAALDMSYELGQKQDFAGELAELNSHGYLFDEKLQSADDLAVSYNNRCFAYMKLGDLPAALRDCTTSLKYGRIPDAFQKEQELMKQLNGKAMP